MTKYRYLPIDSEKDEIRLVVIHPGRFHDPVRISIIHESLEVPDESAKEDIGIDEVRNGLPPDWDVFETLEGRAIYALFEHRTQIYTTWEHPNPEYDTSSVRYRSSTTSTLEYEALSYVWGSSEDQATVEVVQSGLPDMKSKTVDLAPRSSIQVSRNLRNTIRNLRAVAEPRTMWIDAICINQADQLERSREVRRMRDIYTLASRVVMYLGPSSSNSHLALSTLCYLGQQVEISKDMNIMPAPGCKEKDWWNPVFPIPHDDGVRQAIIELTMRSFFQRLWIIQEIQLANHRSIVQSGNVHVLWYNLRRGLIRSWGDAHKDSNQKLYTDRARSRLSHVNDLSLPLSHLEVSKLLSIVIRSECSDPRDKIFGLLGLLPIRMARQIQAQYSDTISEVYKKAFLTFLNCSRRFQLLSLAHTSQEENFYSLPSWVPDLSQEHPYLVYSHGPYQGSGSAAQFKYIPPGTLEATGVDLTSVRSVSEALPKHLQHIVAIAKRFWASTGDVNSTGGTSDQALTRTLALDRLRPLWPVEYNFPALEEAIAIFERCYNGEIYVGRFSPWIASISAALEGNRIFETENGLIGIGYETTRPEDRVIALLGCSFPIIIRGVSASHYQIVGQCYLHGVMSGEAFLGPAPKPWVVQKEFKKSGRITFEVYFRNTVTNSETYEDPRLGELPEEWIEDLTQRDDMCLPYKVRFYRNKITDECINSDPRLLPAALRERGVLLRNFLFV